MTLAFYDTTRTGEAAQTKQASRVLSPDMAEHIRTYRQFVFFAQIAAIAVPFFVAFLLYWTT
ncbi:MAG: hypothetical protein ABSC72_01595 [Methylovirgula sp.]|jgi:hypothetical protein